MTNGNLTVLQVYNYLFRRFGGPATVVPALSRELACNGCGVSILTIDYDKYDVEDFGNAKPYKLTDGRHLENLVADADIVHIHGIWLPFENRVMRVCRRIGKRYIITPHCSLLYRDICKTPFKLLKKQIAWYIYVRKNLVGSSGFHVTSEIERRDMARMGLRSACAVIPNGINIDEFATKTDKSILQNLLPHSEVRRLLVYFSRIGKTKGLNSLARAWGQIGKEHPEWHLLIAGPDDDNQWHKIQRTLDSYGSSNYSRCGYLTGKERKSILQHADILILPTLWEGFGIVVAEALTAGTPVITTTETPWNAIEEVGCGWLISPGTANIVRILKDVLTTDPRKLKEMGEKGRAYVNEEFDWRDIAPRMREYYEYILGRRQETKFVFQLPGNGNPSLPIRCGDD